MSAVPMSLQSSLLLLEQRCNRSVLTDGVTRMVLAPCELNAERIAAIHQRWPHRARVVVDRLQDP